MKRSLRSFSPLICSRMLKKNLVKCWVSGLPLPLGNIWGFPLNIRVNHKILGSLLTVSKVNWLVGRQICYLLQVK